MMRKPLAEWEDQAATPFPATGMDTTKGSLKLRFEQRLGQESGLIGWAENPSF